MEVMPSFFNQHLTNQQKYIVYQHLLLSPHYNIVILELFNYGLQNNLINDLYLLIELIAENNIILANNFGVKLNNYLKEKELLLTLENMSL